MVQMEDGRQRDLDLTDASDSSILNAAIESNGTFRRLLSRSKTAPNSVMAMVGSAGVRAGLSENADFSLKVGATVLSYAGAALSGVGGGGAILYAGMALSAGNDISEGSYFSASLRITEHLGFSAGGRILAKSFPGGSGKALRVVSDMFGATTSEFHERIKRELETKDE